MSGLDIFAIVVLTVVVLSTVALIIILGALPGRIARNRQHPHAQAVTIAGWIGLIFMPIWPLALIWAYVDAPRPAQGPAEIQDLTRRVAAVENALHVREAAE